MKIIFIVGDLNNSHSKNRIEEFISNGYDVHVYGFLRGMSTPKVPYSVEILGDIENGNYIKRLKKYYDAFKKIKNVYRGQQVLYFILGLDKAIFFTLFGGKADYIYEEADLVYTYFPIKIFRDLFKWIDKKIILRAKLAILTSEGFVKYHFGNNQPNNVVVVPNRLNKATLKLEPAHKNSFNKNHIRIGFVGWPRFKSVLNFIDVFCSKYPQHEFHVYGAPVSEEFEKLTKYPNYYLHGRFKNPEDLPNIYSNIDMVLSTYDVEFENVRYAEPNKIYESIFFETPIIVSKKTFLSDKVARLGIGYSIDALNSTDICDFINGLSSASISEKIKNAAGISKKDTININADLFHKLRAWLGGE